MQENAAKPKRKYRPRIPIIAVTIFIEWMLNILKDYNVPVTVRQMFYQLVSRGKVPNDDRYYQKVSRDLTTGREDGRIDPASIEDRGRYSTDGDYDVDRNASEFVQAQIEKLGEIHRYYNYPKWKGQPVYIELWCEKQALVRIFEEIGFQGLTRMILKNEIAPFLNCGLHVAHRRRLPSRWDSHIRQLR